MHEDVSQFMCSEEDMRDYGISPMEVEANAFASELLMPTFHFREACGKTLPSMAIVEQLADEFATTLTATAIRFADVSRHRIVIVWHFQGKVKWSYSNPQHKLPFVMASREPPAYCSATLDESEVSDGMDYYEDADWFPELTIQEEILEETKRMPRMNAGLTLLYFP